MHSLFSMDTVEWSLYISRLGSMMLAAALAAQMIHRVKPIWHLMSSGERAWAVGLMTYCTTVVVWVALVSGAKPVVFPDSVIWFGIAASLLIFHRAMFLTASRR